MGYILKPVPAKRGGGGEVGPNYRDGGGGKGTRGPIMLHMLYYSAVLFVYCAN
jgi:hypothetical protein